MRALAVAGLLLSLAFAGCLSQSAVTPQEAPEDAGPAATLRFGDRNVSVPAENPDAWGDATVIAVVDFGLNPYHWDFLAERMPQHRDSDPGNDLPLDRPASEWLPGFDNERFSSFTRVNLTLEKENGDKPVAELREADDKEWQKVKRSTPEDAHVVWFPGTKVIAAVDFSGTGIYQSLGAHGSRVSSVSVGNLYGTCAECVLVFVNNAGEHGLNWAMSQPWIDVVTNSYGMSTLPVWRDRIYAGSDTEAQRQSVERGQSIFFSAGNGQENAFLIPNPTLLSSQEGPDWIITVGAVSPKQRASYSGSGKPADIASIGSSYPSHGGTTVDGKGTFGGTSSATPTTAGIYARGLWWARTLLDGPSRTQADGVIAQGPPLACAEARPDCELADGALTVFELRTRLLHGAVHTPAGMVAGPVEPPAATPPSAELEFLNEGHGTYFGRMDGPEAYLKEFERFVAPLTGAAAPLERPAGEKEWMTVLSYCTQDIWGEWAHGYYLKGNTTLPGTSPQWPLRSAIERACPALTKPPRVA